jgi:hypothetical protein
MQPIRIERIAAEVEVNGKSNGHANGHTNGHTNGANGKSRRTKTPVVVVNGNDSEVFVEVNGK